MKKWYINKIIVDSREKLRGQKALQYYNDKFNVRLESLPYGDYLFITDDDKKIIFEFKNCKDFIKSMEDKSLFNEIANQSMNYTYSFLVVCGDFDKTYKELYFSVQYYRYKYKTLSMLKNRLPKQVKGAIRRLYSMNVPIIFVDSEMEAFEEMMEISGKIADSKNYGGIVRPKKGLEENSVITFLTTMKGIGRVKAERIVNELNINCLMDLCEKTPSEFRCVRQLSDNNIRDIWRKVHNQELGRCFEILEMDDLNHEG